MNVCEWSAECVLDYFKQLYQFKSVLLLKMKKQTTTTTLISL